MDGIHHVAVFTADYAATAAFWREALGAEAPDRCEQPSVVHVGGAILHVFEEAEVAAPEWGAHLHHVALQASDLEEFVAVRERLVAHGASDGRAIDFGAGHVSLIALDPDGGMVEVALIDVDLDALPFDVEPHR